MSTDGAAPTGRAVAPEPLGHARLSDIEGVLGKICRERAADYASTPRECEAPLPTRPRLSQALINAKATAEDENALPLGVIAEIKRASPSQGAIAPLDPVHAARAYLAGGATALSVLTEPRHFGGQLSYLRTVADAVPLPLLRKEFVVHPAQVREAAEYGASAVLLMVSVLGEATASYLRYCEALGLEALVEVHDDAELRVALEAGTSILGVNNRDLRSLAIDLSTAPRLIMAARSAGFDGLCVAESGYRAHAEVAALAGVADAVLVGTSLAGSGDLTSALRALRRG